MAEIKTSEYVVSIDKLAPEFADYRILQISDIHLGRGNRAGSILETVSRLQADLVVLTGDMVHRKDSIHLLAPFLSDLARTIHPPDGFFGVWGNHDLWVSDNDVKDLPIRWLNNELVQIRRASAVMNLIGVIQKDWTRMDLVTPLKSAVPEAPIILLAHFPSTVYLCNGIIDLVIAGHTHAGQVRLPGLPFATNDDLSWRHARGVSKIGKTTLVISAGIGHSGPLAFRCFAPPEVTLIRVTHIFPTFSK